MNTNLDNIKKVVLLYDRSNYTIDLETEVIENRMTYACLPSDEINKIDREEFLKEFEKFDVFSWDKEYDGGDPFSKERWTLEVYFKDDTGSIFKHGKAKFPENFFDFLKFIENTYKNSRVESGNNGSVNIC